jgi:cytochrome c oxidase assembly protein subunit 15
LRQQQGEPASAELQTATAAARLAHRVTASVALLLVIMMVMVCFGSHPPLWRQGLLALALLGLALFLAVLGVWSSAARVPAVAMGNLLGGFLMLSLCVRLAVPRAAPLPSRLRGAVAVVAALLMLLLASGGLVSASLAGLSCDGWSDCGLQAAWQASGWDALNPWREPSLSGTPPDKAAGALANSLHRHAAVALAVLLVPLALGAFRHGRRAAGAALLGLLVAQVGVGMAMASMGLPLGLALLHNLLATALLASVFALY